MEPEHRGGSASSELSVDDLDPRRLGRFRGPALGRALTKDGENFVFARADGLLPSDRPAVIFCDSYRRQKVLALATRLDLEVETLVHTPMESPTMSQLVRVKSAIDACRLRLLGVDSG